MFQIWSENFLVLRRFKRDTVINLHSSSFLSDFNENFIFSTYFLKIPKFHKNPFSRSRVVPCGRKEGRKDGRTDRRMNKTRLIAALRNFANVPINEGRNC